VPCHQAHSTLGALKGENNRESLFHDLFSSFQCFVMFDDDSSPFDDHDNEKLRAKVKRRRMEEKADLGRGEAKRLQRRCPWIN
jgi:hypothetical protein